MSGTGRKRSVSGRTPGSPWRIGLIGCGDVAERGHLPAILKHRGFDLAGVCDVRRERAELLSLMAGGVPVFTDYRALLADTKVDAVVLALHPEISVGIAQVCLERGLPVLDEKPLARSREEGRPLVEKVRSLGVVYQVGFCFRYATWVGRFADLCRRIGTPALYRISIFDEVLDRNNPEHFNRIQQILAHSSAVVHEGSHVIDYFQFCNPSRLVRVKAAACRTEPDLKGANLWSAQFELADGSILELEIGWLLPELPPCRARVVGPAGHFVLEYGGAGSLACSSGTTALEVPRCVPDFGAQLEAFARAIETGCGQVATVDDGWRALAATEACQESARNGRTVEIPEV